jgi:transposase
MISSMARKSYTDDFRRQAVDLYESTEGATLSGIASDLGIARGTLADWVATFGSGTKTASTSTPSTSPSTSPGLPGVSTADESSRRPRSLLGSRPGSGSWRPRRRSWQPSGRS